MERQKSIVCASNVELKSKICSIRSGQKKEQIFNSISTYHGMNLPTLATARPSMACAAERLMLNPLATCVSAADKRLAHPNNLIQTIVCNTIHKDKIKYFPPSSYPEKGKIEGMTQERTMLIADFDVAFCKHVERTNNILNIVELANVFTKKYFHEKEELTKVVKAKRDVVRIKSKTYAMEVHAIMEDEVQDVEENSESEEVRLTAQTTLLQDHVKTWGTTQQTLNKCEEKIQTLGTNKRMLVTLEEDKKAEKKSTNAVGDSSIKAPLKSKDGKPIISCRRLKLETEQVADDVIYSCASNAMNVRIKKKSVTHFCCQNLIAKSHRRKILLPLKICFSVPSYS
jgi:hypothetical protein